MKSKLPERIEPGEVLEVQLSPFGDYPNGDIVQKCDKKAFENVVKAFKGELLVDFEHKAEMGGDTDAAAWVQSVRVDDELGLMATFKFTDIGAKAVSERRLRFLSPVWFVDNESRPCELISVGLTNKPNLPVRPLLNRAGVAISNVEEKENTTMKEQLIALLGLAPEATDEDIIAAVSALREKSAAQEEAALNAEAEAVADENADKVQNRAAFVACYKANPEAAKAMLATMKPAAPQQTVCNKAAAQTPAPMISPEDADKVIANRWKAMAPGAEKDAYLIQNKAAIQRGLQVQD